MKHILYDVWVFDPTILQTIEPWQTTLPQLARQAGATIIAQRFHQFEPMGVTGMLLLAESHVSVHTWPERHLAALDIFTCGTMDGQLIVEGVRAWLTPQRDCLRVLTRGQR